MWPSGTRRQVRRYKGGECAIDNTGQDGDLHDVLHGELAGAGGEDGIIEEA